jgi:hypothetical protein
MFSVGRFELYQQIFIAESCGFRGRLGGICLQPERHRFGFSSLNRSPQKS